MWLHVYYEEGEIESWEKCLTLEAAVRVRGISYWSQMYGTNGKRNPAPGRETLENEWLGLHQDLGSDPFEMLKWMWLLDWAREYCERYGEPQQHIEPALADAYRTAMYGDDSGIGSATVYAIINTGADVVFGQLPTSVYGRFSPSRNLITINESLRGQGNAALAAVLIHETYHAQEFLRRGNRAETAAECLQEELDAFRLEAKWWYERYGRYGKRSPNSAERSMNNLVRAWLNKNLKEDWVLLSEGYQEQCLGGVVR